ncbi:MAG: DUF748 domain-containing protein, partial [Deltaproteobacteria bacterium]|nr:DUF748 domain-containing protein [Deltaproteobacteria bacterium]
WRFSLQEARLTGGEIVYRDSAWAETEQISLVPEEVQVQRIGGEADSPVRFRLRAGQGTLVGEGSLRLSPFALHTQAQLTGVDLIAVRPLLIRVLAAESVGGTIGGTVRIELATRDGTQAVGVSGALDTTTLALSGVPEPGSSVAWESGHVELREGSTVVPLNLGLSGQFSRFSLRRAEPGDLSIEQMSGNLQLTQEQRGKPSDSPSPVPGEGWGESVSGLQSDRGTPHPGPFPQEERELSLQAQGVVDLNSLTLTHAPEQQILLGCHHARAELSEGSRLLPLDLRVRDLALEYPYVQVVRSAAGGFQLFSPTPSSGEQVPAAVSTPQPPATEQPPPAVHVDRATVRGGEVLFADQTLTPPQTVSWQDVRLDLTKVGYPPPLAAEFTLHALNEDGAPIQLQGTMERQGEQTLVRVRGEIARLSLARFNPYLAPYLGYQVRTGALSLNFDLLIPGDRLQANTKVTLHDLGLGGTQGSSPLEKQVGLSLSLVIALLKDLNGNINLGLPVEGRLNEPGFHLGGTILRAVRDALIGAVTSPLKLLGAVFSSKGRIQNFSLEPIRFVPGTSRPSGPGKEQSARLGGFLSQRPELDLRLSGHTGPDDIRVLTDQLVLAQLQDSAPPAGGQNTPGAEQEGKTPPVAPQDEVRQFLVSQLNQPGSGGAPALSAQAAALLDQLRGQTVVSQQALDRLAQERVQAVMTGLTANPAIALARLHLASEKLRGQDGAEVRYMLQAREGR